MLGGAVLLRGNDNVLMMEQILFSFFCRCLFFFFSHTHPPPLFHTRSLSSPTLQDDLVFLRVRTKKHEVMIAPDKEYLLIVVQNPNIEEEHH
jgi:hypothetical protein